MQTLTQREQECVQSWYQYKTMKKAGKALGISPRTVQTHCYSAMKKLLVSKKQHLFDLIVLN
jgi:DNA-binding CsgD family transcriptional regulator